jgi:protein-L-isoaspartate(D-aspartate) O-methyltransferase
MEGDDAARAARERLVAALRATGALRSPAVARAFQTVPRHRLLEEFWTVPRRERPWAGPSGPGRRIDPQRPDADVLALAYLDDALITRVRDGRPTSSTSQPSLMAHMLEALALRPGMRVLEIGAGIGYNAALLAEIVGDQRLVTSVDIDADLVAQAQRLLAAAGYGDITVVAGDGSDGWAARGPYDRIVATVECPDVAPAWVSQLASGGRMLVPLRHGFGDPLLLARAAPPVARGRCIGWAGFLAMQGRLEGHGLWPAAGIPEGWPRAEDELPPDLAGLAASADDASDFDYYLAIVDGRVAGPLTLVDDDRGAAAIDPARGVVVVDADGDAVAGDLLAHLRRWRALGQPRMEDFVSSFAPLDAPQAAGARGREWTIDRVVHRQTLSLRPLR